MMFDCIGRFSKFVPLGTLNTIAQLLFATIMAGGTLY